MHRDYEQQTYVIVAQEVIEIGDAMTHKYKSIDWRTIISFSNDLRWPNYNFHLFDLRY